jgi:hypothetical protein
MAQKTLVRRKKGDLVTSPVDSLRQALASERFDRELQWAESLEAALAGIEHGLQEKLSDASAPDGPSALFDQSTSSRQVERLCRTQGDLLAQVVSLRQEIHCAKRRASSAAQGRAWDWDIPAIAACGIDFESIRDSAEAVLAQSEKSAELETKLIQEGVNTDLGAGD